MQIPNVENTDRLAQTSSCEIIQEIFGLGANSFLRENDEDLLKRIFGKYKRHSSAHGRSDKNEDMNMEHLIRRTLFLRRMDLSIGSGVAPSRKQSLISTNSRSTSGTVDKAASDSAPGNRRIRLA